MNTATAPSRPHQTSNWYKGDHTGLFNDPMSVKTREAVVRLMV